MKRKGALIAVGLFIALCGSACSNLFLNGIATGGSSTVMAVSTTATISALPDQILVSDSGTGNQALGTFQLHGRIYYGISCKGHGLIQVTINSHPDVGTRCPELGEGAATDISRHGRAQFRVRAPSHVRWQIEIYEKPAR